MTEKKRGRPPLLATLESRAQIKAEKAFMAERTSRQAQLGATEIRSSVVSTDLLSSLETARKQVLKEFKHGQSTPDQHAYEMASLGDEWFEGGNLQFAEEILAHDATFKSTATKIRRKAGGTNIRKSRSRSEPILETNRVLIKKIGTSPAFNLHSVATRIHEEWCAVGHCQSGEPASIKRRGDDKAPPSVRTIRRWIEKSKLFDKPYS